MNDSANSISYRLNEPDVTAEDFRTEILAVDLKQGHYHSLRAGAVPIWRLLLEGRDLNSITELLAFVYGKTSDELRPEIASYVAALESSSLIVPDTSVSAPKDSTPPAWLESHPPTHEAPVLETYTEMQDLLMLDPIHDADVTGWPHTPEAKTDLA